MSQESGAGGKGKLIVVVGALALGVLGVACAGAPEPPEAIQKEPAAPTDPASPAGAGSGDAPTGAVVSAIRARGTLRVAMDTGEPPWTGTPPMYFRNTSGADDGFDYRLALQIAEALSVPKVEVVHAKYGDLPALLAQPDRVDVLISGYSPSEEAGIVWSDPYLEYGLCLIVSADSTVQTTADLWGKTVGIFDDEAAAADVDRIVKGYKELVRLEDGYWDQLVSGRLDAFIYDYPYAVAEINAFYKANPHRAGAFRIAQFNLTDSTYAVGVRATDSDLVAVANAAIARWLATEAYTEAIRSYLSANLAAPAAPKSAKVVKVKAGDTLSKIATRELGSSERWKELWALNKARFPNPHLIEVGDEVVMP